MKIFSFHVIDNQMCSGTEASFITAVALTATGVATCKIKLPRKFLPLSLTPFFFTIQQAIEGLVRLATNSSLQALMSYLYLLFTLLFYGLCFCFSLVLFCFNYDHHALLYSKTT